MKSKTLQAKISRSSRRSIIFVFAVTLAASFAFWLYPGVNQIWQKISQPLIIGDFVFQKKFDPAPVLAEIENLTKDLQGVYGIYIYRFADKESYGFRQSEIFPAASLMKLPVILALYQAAEAGKVDLNNRPTGSNYTYRQLAQRMGHFSDNIAQQVLVNFLGAKKIQQTIDELGMAKTSFEKYETTPEDMGKFFRKLYQDNLINPVSREEILGFLTKTIFEDWLPAGVPADIRVAHKIGKDLGNFNDAGIVFGSEPFVLVIMSKFARESKAVKVLPQISKAVWEFETNGKTK